MAPGSLIRPEKPGDATRIRQIHEVAFERTVEADIVDALHTSGAVVLSMVAVVGGEEIEEPSVDLEELTAGVGPSSGPAGPEIYGGEIVGHALVTEVTVVTDRGETTLLGLGPVAVSPADQGVGIGTHLVSTCLEQLRSSGYAAVVVTGKPDFFERFGFTSAERWGLRREHEIADEEFMILELSPGTLAGLSGAVRYPPEFKAD